MFCLPKTAWPPTCQGSNAEEGIMSKVSTKWISLVGLTAMAVAFTMAGCAGSKTDNTTDNNVGGSNASGGADNGGASSSDGGKTSANGGATSVQSGTAKGGSTGTSSLPPLPDGVTCGPTAAPGNALLTDFSEVAAGTYSGSTTFTWGNSAKTLTGGTFFYGDAGDSAASPAVPASALSVEIVDAHAHITGAIVPNKYAGFGFWFGPCTDARAYKGLSFKISGDLSNSQLQIQVQTSRNYPVDTKNKKGECTADVAKAWDTCASNAKTYSNLVLTATAQTIELPWTDLVGGVPIDPLEPAELLGFQWHFNCGPTACNPDVVIDDVTFY